MIDIHAHILPGLDDGAKTWKQSLQMARLAMEDGIKTMVATPHLFKTRSIDLKQINHKKMILQHIDELRQKLLEEKIPLEIIPGCDFPLGFESLQLLENGQVLTINDANRYLLLELPDTSLPPATEEICFRLLSKGITPILTHPERHMIIQQMPHKLKRLIDLGCLAQMTGNSLTGWFGRGVKKLARQLVKLGYIHLLATDTHNLRNRPPVLSPALIELTRLVGEKRARAMVHDIPEKIIQGEPCF
ncbi:MAG: CpsB/CapC family capsule biosynthesis tyrosine phosphatase [Desulfobaccales bacterium]